MALKKANLQCKSCLCGKKKKAISIFVRIIDRNLSVISDETVDRLVLEFTYLRYIGDALINNHKNCTSDSIRTVGP